MNVKLSFTVGKVETFRFLDSNGAEKTTIICILTGVSREKKGKLTAQ